MNSCKLLEKYIKESGYKKSFIASKLGILPPTFSYKLRGRVDFTLREMFLLKKLLHISADDCYTIFFAKFDDETETKKIKKQAKKETSWHFEVNY